MKYLIGSKKEFHDFVNSIKQNDKVGILTHNDLDGLASGIFLEKILMSKGIKLASINFINYAKEMFEKISNDLKEKGITKIFITDISADSIDLDGFIELRKNFDVFFIDHHLIIEGDWDKKNVIKNETYDCSAFVLYDLAKDYFDCSELNGLNLATMVSEWSFNGEENLKYIIDRCDDINNREDIFSSKAMHLAKVFGSAITYYRDDLDKAYDLIKQNNLEELEKIYEIIEEKMKEAMQVYLDNAQYYENKKIYFGMMKNAKFVSPSNMTTRVSRRDESCAYLIAHEIEGDMIKISSRSQEGLDVNLLLRKGIEGLDNSIAGGHKKAAGATILKKDLDKFKENILK